MLSQLMEKAESGDIESIRLLYREATDSGMKPMQEHWALKGALAGDPQFLGVYSEYFVAMPPERRERVLSALKESKNSNADELLRQLVSRRP